MENNLFKIHSEYKPTGDQPTAIDSIVKNIENGVKDQVLLLSLIHILIKMIGLKLFFQVVFYL